MALFQKSHVNKEAKNKRELNTNELSTHPIRPQPAQICRPHVFIEPNKLELQTVSTILGLWGSENALVLANFETINMHERVLGQ